MKEMHDNQVIIDHIVSCMEEDYRSAPHNYQNVLSVYFTHRFSLFHTQIILKEGVIFVVNNIQRFTEFNLSEPESLDKVIKFLKEGCEIYKAKYWQPRNNE